jgi:hypothetical protein
LPARVCVNYTHVRVNCRKNKCELYWTIVWLRHVRLWLCHARVWFLNEKQIPHAEFDFYTHECNFHTHECNFHTHKFGFDTHECDYNTYECDHVTHECDFDSYECDYDTHECDYYTQHTKNYFKHIRIHINLRFIGTRVVQTFFFSLFFLSHNLYFLGKWWKTSKHVVANVLKTSAKILLRPRHLVLLAILNKVSNFYFFRNKSDIWIHQTNKSTLALVV